MSVKLRNEFVRQTRKQYENAEKVWLQWYASTQMPNYNSSSPEDDRLLTPSGKYITKYQLDIDMRVLAGEYKTAENSKVILFSTEQLAVFLELIENRNFLPSIDYRLPFPNVWISFTTPLTISAYNGSKVVLAFLLEQKTENQQEFESTSRLVKEADTIFSANSPIISVDWDKYEIVTFNKLAAIFQDLNTHAVNWTSMDECIVTLDECDPSVMEWKEKLRRLAAACIAYINCENVYLEKMGEVPEAVNRKREAKGKSRLEPYYVCRVRGVQYDGSATGEGSKHGIRYDVRGHFRRLTTGKTIWVRPHQRGLENELYIPKVYKVDKGSKPSQS